MAKNKNTKAAPSSSKTGDNQPDDAVVVTGTSADSSQKGDGKAAAASIVTKKGKTSAPRGSSPDRKRFKITTHVDQPNKRAWQIRGVRIRHGLHGCFFKKSISSGQDEQPYLRNFVSKVERYPFFRQQELGFMFVGTRVDSNGDLIPANSGHSESEWHLFVAAEKDVGTMQDWLDVVCNRMNEDDIAGNDKLFKWKVAFTVTSWGDNVEPEKLCNLIKFDEVVELVVGLHSLVNPHNRGKALSSVPFEEYFETREEGQKAIEDHFQTLL